MRQAPRLVAAGAVVGAAWALAPIARRHRAAAAPHRHDACAARGASPPTTGSPSFPDPTPALSRWRYGRCSASAAWTCSPGRISASAGSPTSSRELKPADTRVLRPTTGTCPISPASTSTATWSSPGTVRQRACACRTAIGYRRPPRPHLRRRDVGAVRAGRRLAQNRRRHLLLAKGTRRGSGARHDRAVAACHRAAAAASPELAGPQALPARRGRTRARRPLRRRHRQHAVAAVRRGLPRCAALGRNDRRPQRVAGARRRQRRGAVRLDRATPWIANLAVDPKTRSNTSVCMRFTDVAGGAADERGVSPTA